MTLASRITNQRVSVLTLIALMFLATTSAGQNVDLPPPPPKPVNAFESAALDEGGRRFGLIVVGLPGDKEHAVLFQQAVLDLSKSMTALAGVRNDRLVVVSGSEEGEEFTGTSAEDAREVIGRLTQQLQTDDALWVFFVGHGSHDGRHTWFHLRGADLHEGDWADLFARIKCHEQVFWLTQSASGGFVRALSRPNRIVIAATEPQGEVNETRFPHVLNDVLENVTAEMDLDGDGRLSLLELFRATNAGVVSYFEDHKLAATEHAQLDDNGDGKSSEAGDLIKPGVEQTDANVPRIDGALAAKIFVTTTIPPPKNPPQANDSP